MMKKSMNTAQSGFTLIELIVVIVILGILAATALPKFANLGGDARVSSLQAAKGALSATAAMAHGKYLLKPEELNPVFEGKTINLRSTGYPAANQALVDAAGLEGFTVATETGTNTPTINTGEIAIIPKGIANTATGKTCFIKYTEAAAGGAPTISNAPDASQCE
ncbi:type II secretion system protein [Massilia horti]|uniref:Type II secretion system protein n=1 Tax=Massilia horti TaxID=2562153 RepID=A0A4Y9T255_9BURK|nr:type II secretion system protein [Massilia horti]TFW30987.1 type II secretion system protein [Massilia horti]